MTRVQDDLLSLLFGLPGRMTEMWGERHREESGQGLFSRWLWASIVPHSHKRKPPTEKTIRRAADRRIQVCEGATYLVGIITEDLFLQTDLNFIGASRPRFPATERANRVDTT